MKLKKQQIKIRGSERTVVIVNVIVIAVLLVINVIVVGILAVEEEEYQLHFHTDRWLLVGAVGLYKWSCYRQSLGWHISVLHVECTAHG